MIGLPFRVVIWSMVAFGTIAAAAAFSVAAPAAASTSCKTVVVKVHAKHWVWRNERRHGEVVRVHVRVSYERELAEYVASLKASASRKGGDA